MSDKDMHIFAYSRVSNKRRLLNKSILNFYSTIMIYESRHCCRSMIFFHQHFQKTSDLQINIGLQLFDTPEYLFKKLEQTYSKFVLSPKHQSNKFLILFSQIFGNL